MNIYQKLAAARVQFQERGVKMSGKNTFAGYSYFDLSDILPVINKLGSDFGFLCEVSFSADIGTLTVRDTEKPESSIVFTSPMAEASLKGCHAVQNLGAVETYIKRYLYQNAFEIVEADALDKTNGTPGKEPEQKHTGNASEQKEKTTEIPFDDGELEALLQAAVAAEKLKPETADEWRIRLKNPGTRTAAVGFIKTTYSSLLRG